MSEFIRSMQKASCLNLLDLGLQLRIKAVLCQLCWCVLSYRKHSLQIHNVSNIVIDTDVIKSSNIDTLIPYYCISIRQYILLANDTRKGLVSLSGAYFRGLLSRTGRYLSCGSYFFTKWKSE